MEAVQQNPEGGTEKLEVVMETKEKEMAAVKSFKLAKHASGKMTKSTILIKIPGARAPLVNYSGFGLMGHRIQYR